MTTQHTPEPSVPDCLVDGLRNYRRNFGGSGFVTAFDYQHTVVAVRKLEQQRDELLQVAIKVKADLRRMGFQNSTLNDAIAKGDKT